MAQLSLEQQYEFIELHSIISSKLIDIKQESFSLIKEKLEDIIIDLDDHQNDA